MYVCLYLYSVLFHSIALSLKLSYNYIYNCNIGIFLSRIKSYERRLKVVITKNTITNCNTFALLFKGKPIPDFHDNNILIPKQGLYIKIEGPFYLDSMTSIDLSNNYWGLNIIDDIHRKISNEVTSIEGYIREINIVPISTSFFIDAYPR